MVFKKGNQINVGRKCKEETKRKIGLSNIGRKSTEISKKKISETKKKLYAEGKIIHPMLGKFHNEKSKQRMSESRKKGLAEGKIKVYNKNKTLEELYGKERSEEIKRMNSIAHIGKIGWSRGLTKETDERIKKIAETTKNHKRKGKTYEEIYGVEKSKEMKDKISRGNKNKFISEQTKEKIRNAKLGHLVTGEQIKKIKEARAKQIFPKVDTKPEKKVQGYLNELQIPFVPHKRIINIEHAYNCDLFVPSMNLVIECDGNYWHNYPFGTKIDIQRNKEMWAKGYHILRLWENEIKVMELNDLQNVLNKIGGLR